MKYWSGINMEKEKILEFYKQTSQFTDKETYKDCKENLDMLNNDELLKQ